MRTRNVCMALALISVSACGGSGGGGQSTGPKTQAPGNTPAAVGEISVTNNAFSPAAKTVTAGTSVNWAWNTCSGGDGYSGQVCVSHGVNFDDGVNSATQDQGTYSRTFTAAGTYNYHCAVHGTSMSGTIMVQ